MHHNSSTRCRLIIRLLNDRAWCMHKPTNTIRPVDPQSTVITRHSLDGRRTAAEKEATEIRTSASTLKTRSLPLSLE